MTQLASAAPDTRDCRLYRFWVRHPRTGRRILGYVGETVRQPLTRLLEHLQTQPWADTIVGWEVDERVFAGKDAVLAAERATVQRERPLYNYEWNQANPLRIPIPEARRQRWARDAAAGRARWAPVEERPTVVKTPPVAAWRPSGWQQKVALWAVAWLLLTVGLFGWLDRIGAPGPWDVRLAALGATGLLGWGLRGNVRLRWRWWRR